MIGINERIIPYSGEFYGRGNRKVLMIKHGKGGRDRSFFEGAQENSETHEQATIRLMQVLGGVDLSDHKTTELGYIASHESAPGIQWMGVAINEEEADQIRQYQKEIGKVIAVPIWYVAGELWQIPDISKGVPLKNYWESTVFPKLKSA